MHDAGFVAGVVGVCVCAIGAVRWAAALPSPAQTPHTLFVVFRCMVSGRVRIMYKFNDDLSWIRRHIIVGNLHRVIVARSCSTAKHVTHDLPLNAFGDRPQLYQARQDQTGASQL